MRSTTSFCSMKCISLNDIAGLEQAEQQRRRDVVGQIADHAQPVAAGRRQRAQIEFERIGPMQLPARLAAGTPLQLIGQIAIDLDRIQLSRGRKQLCRQRSAARADLHDTARRPCGDRLRRCVQ